MIFLRCPHARNAIKYKIGRNNFQENQFWPILLKLRHFCEKGSNLCESAGAYFVGGCDCIVNERFRAPFFCLEVRTSTKWNNSFSPNQSFFSQIAFLSNLLAPTLLVFRAGEVLRWRFVEKDANARARIPRKGSRMRLLLAGSVGMGKTSAKLANFLEIIRLPLFSRVERALALKNRDR